MQGISIVHNYITGYTHESSSDSTISERKAASSLVSLLSSAIEGALPADPPPANFVPPAPRVEPLPCFSDLAGCLTWKDWRLGFAAIVGCMRRELDKEEEEALCDLDDDGVLCADFDVGPWMRLFP